MRFILPLLYILIIQGCVEKQSTISLVANPASPSISQQELFQKSYAELALVSKSIHNEKEVIDEFANFITIMKTYVNDYATTIERSAYFSQAIRILPIPYAGEVSNATRIVSNSLVTLNDTAISLDKYKKSSINFLNGFNHLGRNPNLPALEKLSRYADDVLIVDALNLHVNMVKIEKTTESLLYVNKIISETSSTATSYIDKVKDFINITPSEEEKEAIEKSEDTFKSKLIQLNKHITLLKNSVTKNRKNISKSRVISDLTVEIERRR